MLRTRTTFRWGMADFVKLWANRKAVVETVSRERAEAAAQSGVELESALLIQCAFRGAKVRGRITDMKVASTAIQRLLRGHFARQRARRAAARKAQTEADAIVNHYVVMIQRIFRGFHSRRYNHSYYARKEYIRDVQKKGEDLVAQMKAARERQLKNFEESERQKAESEFQQLTQNFHHLVSTKAIPGIFNPPYAADATQAPSAYGVPLETHLRVGVKKHLRSTETISKPKPPTSYAAIRGTLRSQGVYGSEVLASREDAKRSKLQQLEPSAFKSGGTATVLDPVANYTPGLSSGTEFVEGWKAGRGIRDLLNSQENKAKRVTAAPFHLAVSKDVVFEEVERAKSRGGTQRR